MRLVLAVFAVAALASAQNCTYDVQPAAVTIASSATTGRISVTTATGCSWTVSNPSLTWLQFDVVQGTGSGAVTYTADANPTALDRTGAISVAGKTVNVTQIATQCTYTLDLKSANFDANGGRGTFKLTTGCLWQPFSNNGNIVSVPDTSTRLGTGNVDYSVLGNSCVYGRSAGINFNTTSSSNLVPAFTVNQDGSPANLTLSANNASAGPEESNGRVNVNTGNGCFWSAFSTETWIQVINGSGAGNGSITYHLLANNTATRTGTIHVGALNYTITQASSGPPVPSIASVTCAANYRADAISPGEILTIFGANLGPATLATLQLSNGNVASFLAGTQVLFDGTPSPMIYTKSMQVSAVAPYGLAGKSTTQVQVIYNGQTSAAVTVPVQAAHPGIFTLDSSGLGPGAILNQDFSVNSSANPAARGSIVSIYATGGGVTDPVPTDGAVTGANPPLLTQTTTVKIGGVNARVLYAGAAPAAVAGLVQINVEVPAGLTPGVTSVVIQTGDYTTTSGVTLVIR